MCRVVWSIGRGIGIYIYKIYERYTCLDVKYQAGVYGTKSVSKILFTNRKRDVMEYLRMHNNNNNIQCKNSQGCEHI